MVPSASTGRRPRRGIGGGAAVDVTLAVFVLVTVVVAITADLQPDARTPNTLAYVLGVGLAAPMLVRRRWPVAALLVTVAVLLAYYAAGYPAIGLAVPVAAALYSAAELGRLRPAIAPRSACWSSPPATAWPPDSDPATCSGTTCPCPRR